MIIRTGANPQFLQARKASAGSSLEKPLSQNIEPPKGGGKDWREFTLNEAMVELPQAALDYSDLKSSRPGLGNTAQTAISALAFVRGYQGLTGGSIEQKMEGASSVALGVAGVLSMVPGGVAAQASQAFMLGQAALEMSLGIRELHEELRLDKTPDWKEIATGSLDLVKGAAAFVPLFIPATADLMNGVQVGALIGKTVLESTIDRSIDE